MITNENADISVIIPTFRRPDMLRTAIQSVLTQRNCTVEIIVVDDHSCDETASVVKEFPGVRYFENKENRGPGYSRKFGLSQCSGKYVAFLDDDDYYIDSDFFSYAIRIMASHTDYVFLAGRGKTLDYETNQYITEAFPLSGEVPAIDYLSGISIRYRVPQTFAIVFSKAALISSGIPDMDMVNHVPMIMRCLQSGNVYFSERAVGVYRQHEGNISKAMTAEFIIENLAEKHQLLPLLKERSADFDSHYWWLRQINNTISYYVYGTNPKMKGILKVKHWCIQNSENKKEIVGVFKKYEKHIIANAIYEFKIAIKRRLGVIQ